MKAWIVFPIVVIFTAACHSDRATLPLQASPSHEPTKPTLAPVEIRLPTRDVLQTGALIQEEVRVTLDGGQGGFFLIQFSNPLDPDTRNSLEKAGAVFYNYLPTYAYYAYLPPESLSFLETLFANGRLRYLGLIPVEAKLEPSLGEKIRDNPEASFDITVQFFEALTVEQQEVLERLMEVNATSFGPVNIAEGSARAAEINAILALPFVKWIEEKDISELGK